MDRRQHTEVDQKITPALPLTDRKSHDAAHIVVFWAALLFAEVADEVGAGIVRLRHNVKQERFDVIEERLMVQEHLRKKA